MKSNIFIQLSWITLSIFFLSSCEREHHHFCDGSDTISITTKVFSTGFNSPRGLEFGPDGNLYVAEGGIGGTNLSTGCDQVVPPVGPYTGSTNGSRISKVDRSGTRTTWVANLPSSQNAFGDISGIADVGFVGNTMYALLTGAGCSRGNPTIPNALIRINGDRSWTSVANLSAFVRVNPVKTPEPDDFEPDGDFYSMVNIGSTFYVVEANHGELDRVTTGGAISRVVDVSAHYGHIVPTSVAWHDGNFYIGNLHPFPATPGVSSIYKVTPKGDISVFATGFNMILGVLFDKAGGLYVLENTVGSPFPAPASGQIVRIDPSGSRQIITTGLNFPTGMTFGPDGKIYVSINGFGPNSLGGGEVLQLSFKCDDMGADKTTH